MRKSLLRNINRLLHLMFLIIINLNDHNLRRLLHFVDHHFFRFFFLKLENHLPLSEKSGGRIRTYLLQLIYYTPYFPSNYPWLSPYFPSSKTIPFGTVLFATVKLWAIVSETVLSGFVCTHSLSRLRRRAPPGVPASLLAHRTQRENRPNKNEVR